MTTPNTNVQNELQTIENKFKIKLPKEYKDFIIKSHLERLDMRRFSTKDKKVESIVKYFFRPYKDYDDDLYGEIQDFTLDKKIPRNLIPIAITPAGNRVLLSISGKDTGNVYYWSWDEEPEPPTQSYQFIRLIEKTLDEFLDALYEIK